VLGGVVSVCVCVWVVFFCVVGGGVWCVGVCVCGVGVCGVVGVCVVVVCVVWCVCVCKITLLKLNETGKFGKASLNWSCPNKTDMCHAPLLGVQWQLL